MSSDLRDLYQEVILDHNKHPRNFGAIEGADRKVDGHNPLCGDKLTLFLRMEGDRIAEVSFVGAGCAISKASASLMTDAVKGRTVAEAAGMFQAFHEMVTAGAEPDPALIERVGKLAVFMGVAEYPTRVKCATLAWHTLQAALVPSSSPVSTENETE
jgi:nitrogen fixation protein NifU and related proteins